MFCEKCGAKLQEGAKFCEKCGNKVDNGISQVGKERAQNNSSVARHNDSSNTKEKKNNMLLMVAMGAGSIAVISVVCFIGSHIMQSSTIVKENLEYAKELQALQDDLEDIDDYENYDYEEDDETDDSDEVNNDGEKYDYEKEDEDEEDEAESTLYNLINIDASVHGYSESDLTGLSPQELTYLRNSVYAKHGYIFESSELNQFFSQFNWYHQDPGVDGSELNDVEKAAVTMIRDYQESNGLVYKPQ